MVRAGITRWAFYVFYNGFLSILRKKDALEILTNLVCFLFTLRSKPSSFEAKSFVFWSKFKEKPRDFWHFCRISPWNCPFWSAIFAWFSDHFHVEFLWCLGTRWSVCRKVREQQEREALTQHNTAQDNIKTTEWSLKEFSQKRGSGHATLPVASTVKKHQIKQTIGGGARLVRRKWWWWWWKIDRTGSYDPQMYSRNLGRHNGTSDLVATCKEAPDSRQRTAAERSVTKQCSCNCTLIRLF